MSPDKHYRGTDFSQRMEEKIRYKISSKPHGSGGWIHWIVSVKPQSYKDPKRLETEKEEGPFRVHAEAKARLDVLNGEAAEVPLPSWSELAKRS